MAPEIASATTSNTEEERLHPTRSEIAVTWIVAAIAVLLVSYISVLMGRS